MREQRELMIMSDEPGQGSGHGVWDLDVAGHLPGGCPTEGERPMARQGRTVLVLPMWTYPATSALW